MKQQNTVREHQNAVVKQQNTIRMGDYRIDVTINGDTVEFITIDHRKEFYNYFP